MKTHSSAVNHVRTRYHSTHAIDQELRWEDAVEAGVDGALARGIAGVEAGAVAAGPADGEAPGGRHGRVEEQVNRLQRDLRPVKAPLHSVEVTIEVSWSWNQLKLVGVGSGNWSRKTRLSVFVGFGWRPLGERTVGRNKGVT